MSEPIIFFVPVKIVSEANASYSRNWWEKTSRQNGIIRALDLWMKPIEKFPLPCEVILTRSGKKFLDDDNLQYAFKKVRDHISWRIITTTDYPKIENSASNLKLVTKKTNKGCFDSDPRIKWRYKQEKGPIGFWVTLKEIQDEQFASATAGQ